MVNYGLALAAGVVQFLVMTAFARGLHEESYSTLAWTFSLFPQYLLLLDLGLQAELVRRFAGVSDNAKRDLFAEAFFLRLLMAVVCLILFAMHAQFAALSISHAAASCVFLISLVPSAFFLTLEAEGYASGKKSRTVLMRVARLVSFGTIGVLYFFAFSKNTIIEKLPFLVLCAAYAVAWAMVLVVFIFLHDKTGNRLKGEFITKFVSQPKNAMHRSAQLLFSAKEYVVAFIFSWLVNTIFNIVITRHFGERGLAGFFFSQTLCVPLALALQVLSGITIANMSQNKVASGENSVQMKHDISWKLVWLVVFAGAALYVAVVSRSDLLAYVTTPNVAKNAKAEFPWLVLAQLFMGIGGIVGVKLFAQGKKNLVWISTASSLPAFAIFWAAGVAFPEIFKDLPVSVGFCVVFSTPCLLLLLANLNLQKPKKNREHNSAAT